MSVLNETLTRAKQLSLDEDRLGLEISEKGIFYSVEDIKRIRKMKGAGSQLEERGALLDFYLPNGNTASGKFTRMTPYSIVIEGDRPVLYEEKTPIGEIVFQKSKPVSERLLDFGEKARTKIAKTAKDTIFNLTWIDSVYLKVLPPVVLIIAWEAASRLGYLKPLILPAPSAILRAGYYQLESGELIHHIGISLYRISKGYAVGAGLGLALGLLVGIFKRFDQATSSLLNFLRPIPMFAWLPLIILWLGISESTKTTIIAIGSFWPVLLNVIAGVKSVDKKYLEVASILEKNRYQVLTKVVLPSALPSIFTGLRIGIGMAWGAVVAAEVIASTSGIGFLLMYSREMWQPDITFVGTFAIGIIGLIIERLFKFVEDHLIKWNRNNISNNRKGRLK